jgi:hypothetical protein
MTGIPAYRPLLGADALSLIAVLIHAWIGTEHLGEWWAYRLFFLAAAIFLAGDAVAQQRRRTPALLELGVAVNLAIILCAWTRTIGIPPFGPHAGEIEHIGVVDATSKLAEAGLVVLLLILPRLRATPGSLGGIGLNDIHGRPCPVAPSLADGRRP